MTVAFIALGAAHLATLFALAQHRAHIERLRQQQARLVAFMSRHLVTLHRSSPDAQAIFDEIVHNLETGHE